MMLLSFIIPTYNRGAILERTYLSLMNAIEGLPVEVIIVNDYKQSELTLPFLKDNVQVLNNPKGGAASARNFGATFAKGNHLIFLDDDIILNKTNVKTLIDLHESSVQDSYMINWIYPPELIAQLRATKFGRYLINNNLTSMKGWRANLYWNDMQAFPVDAAASYCLVLHREVFLKSGGYNENFPLAGFEDYDFPKRLIAMGVNFFIYPLDTVWHNESDRVDLNSFLKRKYNTSITRRVAVELGYKELSIDYSALKKSTLSVLQLGYPLLRGITWGIPNADVFDGLYNRMVNILTAIKIYSGYTKHHE